MWYPLIIYLDFSVSFRSTGSSKKFLVKLKSWLKFILNLSIPWKSPILRKTSYNRCAKQFAKQQTRTLPTAMSPSPLGWSFHPLPLKIFSRVVQVRPAMKKEPCGQWETENNGAALTTCRDKNRIKLIKFQLFSGVNQSISRRKSGRLSDLCDWFLA